MLAHRSIVLVPRGKRYPENRYCSCAGVRENSTRHGLSADPVKMEDSMRTHALGIAAAVVIFVLPISASAQSIEIGPGGVRIGRSGHCEELRRACENKDRLGERGEGNCRRYREECGRRRSRQEVCAELRSACLNKDRLGEQGEGNCRRYRQTCR
jgi:hypothetical protein